MILKDRESLKPISEHVKWVRHVLYIFNGEQSCIAIASLFRHKWEDQDEIVFTSDVEAIIAQKIIEEFIG